MKIKVIIKGKEVKMSRREFLKRFYLNKYNHYEDKMKRGNGSNQC